MRKKGTRSPKPYDRFGHLCREETGIFIIVWQWTMGEHHSHSCALTAFHFKYIHKQHRMNGRLHCLLHLRSFWLILCCMSVGVYYCWCLLYVHVCDFFVCVLFRFCMNGNLTRVAHSTSERFIAVLYSTSEVNQSIGSHVRWCILYLYIDNVIKILISYQYENNLKEKKKQFDQIACDCNIYFW